VEAPIEWPEIIEHLIPNKKIEITIKDITGNRRLIKINGRKELLEKLEGFNNN